VTGGGVVAGGAVALIWARDLDGLIGVDGAMPWRLPPDLARFRSLTWGHAVVMGRRTWDSLPARARPLPGRANIVLSRSPGPGWPGAIVAGSVAEALAAADAAAMEPPLWVIGGASIYSLFLPLATLAEVTVVDGAGGDWSAGAGSRLAFAPRLGPEWRRAAVQPEAGWLTSETGPRYRFERWQRQLSR
jgi:dihydrofolate reductase